MPGAGYIKHVGFTVFRGASSLQKNIAVFVNYPDMGSPVPVSVSVDFVSEFCGAGLIAVFV